MTRSGLPLVEPKSPQIYEKIRNRALGQDAFDFSPFACYIEYKEADSGSGLQYRDCTIDYTRCLNSKCIKKLI